MTATLEQPKVTKHVPDTTQIRSLSPVNTLFIDGKYDMINCRVDSEIFYGVHTIRMFPIHSPDKFISVHYTDSEDKDQEVGVIEDLNFFPESQLALLKSCLERQYHEQVIKEISHVKFEHGFLFFDVVTQRGPEQFIMPWRGDHAMDYGDKGKVLLDAYENRYIIPDIEALPLADRNRFTMYIYW